MAARKSRSQRLGRPGQHRGIEGFFKKTFIELLKAVDDCRCIRTREGQDFHRTIPGDLFFVRLILFENHMEIAAAETKRADTTAPRGAICAKPGSRGGVEVKGTGFDSQFRVGLVRLECGREDLVVERKR